MGYKYESIYTILQKIKDGEYVLPAIQREFVWAEQTEKRMYDLLDSIARKYPFGSMLFWESKPKKYREFDKRYHNDERPDYKMLPNTRNDRKTLVLDGQQRLQSLYLAMFGTYNDKQLYFDVLSNPEREVSERRYEFKFLSEDEVEKENEKIRHFKYENINDMNYFIPFQKIIHSSNRGQVRRSVIKDLRDKIEEWNDKIEDLVGDNLDKVIDAIKTAQNLNYFEVSDTDIENLDMDDILEIFVRINSGGMMLEKSDLMFSLIALKMEKDPWKIFGDLLKDLDRTYSHFDFDKDYFIKCFLVIQGLGARYEVDKLRLEENMRALEKNFDRIGDSIKCCMDFVTKNAKIMCGGILGSYNSLIPLIYWIFKQHGHPNIPQSEYEKIKYFIYMSLYTGATTRSDSRIDGLLTRWGEEVSNHFPLEESLEFMRESGYLTEINEEFPNLNVDLTLNILQDGVNLDPGYKWNRPERDHIFPKHLLREHYPEGRINHFANFWFIPMGMNRNKTDKPPLEYFKKVFECDGDKLRDKLLREKVLPRGAPLDLLKLGNFEKFLEARTQMIVNKGRKFLSY